MESIIQWILGIIVYLLIGSGHAYCASVHNVDSEDGEIFRFFYFIILCLIWPFELGVVLVRASMYYATMLNMIKQNTWNISTDNMLRSEAIALNEKMENIEKVLSNIEGIIQKNNT